ncbi:hypothetical protein SARC_15228 [Sphaeroforma arctica JP610]|uniref:Uncharacterized protein n=1 Tax=Sphaeroforma arctica JP610 TaxID=667725 RepID=A0A0L0F6M6_9EUKA|nr:hypothetical protein SARC_15228 [Sphaeroforma arctica JP610]KNC72221.1 hypothetical protein SARC_15228 [Sphaeroforma arctica JP610]|eukprot:XP_014146123.1 hypothetical protein SARC_15228 [Sphaeroforma arctica JP610]
MATHLDSYETAKVDLVGGHFLVVKNIAERFVELFDDTLSARVKEVRQRGGVKHRETSSNRKSARAGRLKGNHHVLTMHEVSRLNVGVFT